MLEYWPPVVFLHRPHCAQSALPGRRANIFQYGPRARSLRGYLPFNLQTCWSLIVMSTTRGLPTLMSELASAQTIYRIQHVTTAWGLWARDNSSPFSVIHQSRDDTCQCRCLEKDILPCVKCLFTPESVSEYNTDIYKYQTRYFFSETVITFS